MDIKVDNKEQFEKQLNIKVDNNEQFEKPLNVITISTNQQSLKSHARELKNIYDYLICNNKCVEIAKKLEPFVKNEEKTSNVEFKGLSDIYSVIDTISANISNTRDSLLILGVGADIAKIARNESKESEYISKIVNKYEKMGDIKSALETEKEYCYSKDQYYLTGVIFSHYINILRLSVISNSTDNAKECFSKMLELPPSSANSIVQVRASLNSLLEVCDHNDIEQSNIVRTALEISKLKFRKVDNYNRALLTSMIERLER